MIDNDELQILVAELTRERCWSDCLKYGDRALVVLPYMVMELPASEVTADAFDGHWDQGHAQDASQWRAMGFVPKDSGERAQVMHETLSGEDVIRLESPSEIVVHMHSKVYEYLCRQFFRPSFRLHPLPAPITVFEGPQLVAVVSARVLELQDGWSAC